MGVDGAAASGAPLSFRRGENVMSSKERRRPGELVFALVIVVFAAAAFWQSYAISGFTGKATAGVFPMLASGMMVIAGLAILLSTAGKRSAAPDAGFRREILPNRHVTLIGLVVAYLVAMPYLGFMIASGAFLFAAFQYLWGKPVWITAALAAVSLLAIYGIFREIFQVVLPQGSLMRGWF